MPSTSLVIESACGTLDTTEVLTGQQQQQQQQQRKKVN